MLRTLTVILKIQAIVCLSSGHWTVSWRLKSQ